MTFYLVWLVVGIVVGWAFKRFLPGSASMTTAIIAGVVGAFIGGWLANSMGKAAVLLPSAMAAVLGAVVVTGALTAYQLRQKRA